MYMALVLNCKTWCNNTGKRLILYLCNRLEVCRSGFVPVFAESLKKNLTLNARKMNDDACGSTPESINCNIMQSPALFSARARARLRSTVV